MALRPRLFKVLRKIEKSEMTLHKEKWKFGCTEVKFLGHIISGISIKPDPDKRTALVVIRSEWIRVKFAGIENICLSYNLVMIILVLTDKTVDEEPLHVVCHYSTLVEMPNAVVDGNQNLSEDNVLVEPTQEPNAVRGNGNVGCDADAKPTLEQTVAEPPRYTGSGRLVKSTKKTDSVYYLLLLLWAYYLVRLY